MDLVKGVVTAVVMVVAIFATIALVAALFMIIFNIATGVDEHLQE